MIPQLLVVWLLLFLPALIGLGIFLWVKIPTPSIGTYNSWDTGAILILGFLLWLLQSLQMSGAVYFLLVPIVTIVLYKITQAVNTPIWFSIAFIAFLLILWLVSFLSLTQITFVWVETLLLLFSTLCLANIWVQGGLHQYHLNRFAIGLLLLLALPLISTTRLITIPILYVNGIALPLYGVTLLTTAVILNLKQKTPHYLPEYLVLITIGAGLICLVAWQTAVYPLWLLPLITLIWRQTRIKEQII